jgi:hypothetical protein
MDLVLTLVCCVSEPALVCNIWLCTSLDVEAGLCNPLSKNSSGNLVGVAMLRHEAGFSLSPLHRLCYAGMLAQEASGAAAVHANVLIVNSSSLCHTPLVSFS